jgi:hypothetical protein
MEPGSSGARHRAVAFATLLVAACAVLAVRVPAAAAGTEGAAPNLTTASAYLVRPANLIDGHYYESFPGAADFGLTIDGALALASTGGQDTALRKIVAFLADGGKDPSGDTVDEWTGIGTSDASGGAIGKEALLAEVVGDNPENFGGHNLITALDAAVCRRASSGGDTSCPAAGSYLNDTSVFDQALGIMAQFRAGQASDAAAPVRYLESLQSAKGSFPSLIPPSGGPDVDSTAMAVMALALAPGTRAAADVAACLKWLASQQEHNGGFPSQGAESINSTGLAIQALTLRSGAYHARISAAEAFLAAQQNGNGGFNADAGQPGANVRASTQAVSGAVGESFGTLSIDLSSPPAATSHPSPTIAPSPSVRPATRAGHRTSRPAGSARATARPRRSATRGAGARGPGARSSVRQSLAVASPESTHPASAAPSQALPIAIAVVAAVAITVSSLVLGQFLRRRRRPGRTPTRQADPVSHDQTNPATDDQSDPTTRDPADPAAHDPADPGTHDQVSS